MNTDVEIVIVEDNPNDAELMTRVLKKHNLANKFVILQDGAQALDFLAGPNEVPRVIFLDLKLPKIDGIEVLRRIREEERTKQIPVVAITSSTEDRDIRAAYALGVNSYITKPIRFDDFAKVIADVGLYWLVLNKPPV